MFGGALAASPLSFRVSTVSLAVPRVPQQLDWGIPRAGSAVSVTRVVWCVRASAVSPSEFCVLTASACQGKYARVVPFFRLSDFAWMLEKARLWISLELGELDIRDGQHRPVFCKLNVTPIHYTQTLHDLLSSLYSAYSLSLL